MLVVLLVVKWVSTHSRPKAAEAVPPPVTPRVMGFNTQPPEGG